MLNLGKLRAKEQGLLQRKAKLEAELARLRAKEKATARKDDTRRKIVFGAVVLAAVEAGDMSAHYVRRLVRKHAAERDKKLFVGTPFAVADGAAESASTDAPGTAMRE